MIQPGSTLAHYEVTEQIGKGGMGEVYRARDAKLGRQVAIKVLPSEVAQDQERLTRLEREAKLLASLNHPNIAAIYGLEEYQGTRFLVLELVEGDTLGDRLKQGAIPISESLNLSLQIADALKAAHDSGVVHRDLKPENVKVTDEGNVKVLDFGLAKAVPGNEAEEKLSNSPTLSMAATQAGVILGTAAYMSPEQAKGRAVDRRADIWAFGCVLYEMLTGRQSFGKSDVTESLSAVISLPPDWEAMPANLHPRLREAVERCLEKKPARRYQDIGDVGEDIRRVLEDTGGMAPVTRDSGAGAARSRTLWVAAVMLAAMIGGLVAWSFRPAETPSPVRLSYVLPLDHIVTDGSRRYLAVSRDGERIAWVANEQLWVKDGDDLDGSPIEGTNEDPGSPVFSPDGEWIAYWSADAQQLKKVEVGGGLPVPLTRAGNPFGVDWGPDDVIVYGQGDGIWEISGGGGEPRRIVESGPGELLADPQILPGRDWLLVTEQSRSVQRDADVVGSIPVNLVLRRLSPSQELDQRRVLRRDAIAGRYLSSGHLLFVSDDRLLYAAPFDITTGDLGQPISVEGPIRLGSGVITDPAMAMYAVSDNGTLVYASGGGGTLALFGRTAPTGIPVIVDQDGRPAPVAGVQARQFGGIRFSPDGNRLAVWGFDRFTIRDLDSGGETEMPVMGFPIWLGADLGIVGSGQGDITRVFPDDPTGLQILRQESNTVVVTGGRSDGQLILHEVTDRGDRDLYTMSVDEPSGSLTPFCVTPDNERSAVFSPDGDWVAYVSEDTGGDDHVWAQRVTDACPGGRRYRVSGDGGGLAPVWAASGNRIYYLAANGMLAETTVRTEPTFQNLGTRELFRVQGVYYWPNTTLFTAPYDVHPDGERFGFIQPVSEETFDRGVEQIHVVLNWFTELAARVPVD